MHRLVLTSLRVLQYQLQLPIYIYIHTHSHLQNWQVNQSSQICTQTGKGTNQHKHTTHAPTHQNMCPAIGRSAVFKPAISTHQIVSKTFSGRETPLQLHTAENYLIFVRLNSSTLKKRKTPARAARGCYQIKAF